MTRTLRYPVYVISKGRAPRATTAQFLAADGVPYRLVVEEPEAEEYAARYGAEVIEVLPFVDRGGVAARNWCWEHSIEAGAERHWILDDNIRSVQRWHQGARTHIDSRVAFTSIEDFTDRYTNIGLSGMNYVMFASGPQPPFTLNGRVYSCQLIRNEMDIRWRGEWNTDTDLSLQTLAIGLCTVLVNVFIIEKLTTMKAKGGNTEKYQGDGRLKMARSLERQWPGIVTTSRRWQRPQHAIANNWRRFDTPLIRRTDIDWDEIESREVPLTQRRTRDPLPLKSFKTAHE